MIHIRELDVIIPTWNSNNKYFYFIMSRIKENIPLHHLIVIDRYSNDGTVELICSLFPRDKLKIIRTNADLAIARKLGVNLSDTDIILFLDSDILIPSNFKNILLTVIRMLKISNLGAIGFSLNRFKGKDFLKIFRVIRSYDSISKKEILLEGLNHLCRGHMFCVFVKQTLLRDWKPNPLLSSFEDFSLSQHIIKKGYYWIELSYHLIHTKEAKYKGLMRFLKQGSWEGANLRIINIGYGKILLHVLGRLAGSLIKRNLYQFLTYIGYVIGILNYPTFRVWKRG